jgi:hypothetical protein
MRGTFGSQNDLHLTQKSTAKREVISEAFLTKEEGPLKKSRISD